MDHTALSIVSSFHSNPPPPPGAAADLPAAAGDEAVACDACESACHVSEACHVGSDAEWRCGECARDGVASKRWQLGKRKRRRRLMSDIGDGEVSVFRKHTPADNSFDGIPFGASVTSLKSSNARKRSRLQKASAHSAEVDELRFEDTLRDKDWVDMGGGHVEKDIATDSSLLQFSDVLPVQYEDFFVLSLGRVDSRPFYHTTDQIWPIGYRSCWHDKVTGSLFVCEVLDGGDCGPVFKVTRSSCSTSPIPSGSTSIIASNYDQNKEKHDFNFSEEEDCSFQMLISDPPLENDSQCCLGNPPNISVSDSSILKDEIGEFSVEDSSPSSVWEMVAKKCVDSLREILTHKCTFNFRCLHVGNKKDDESLTYLSKFSGSFKFPSMNDDGVIVETVLETLRTWLHQDRFGLEVSFVQEILEFLPGVVACSQYIPLTKRSCYSSSVTVGNSFLQVKTKDGKQMMGDKALDGLLGSCRKAKTEIVQDPVVKSPNFPMGTPLCINFPPEIVGDALQVLEFFHRFSEVLDVGNIFSVEQLEMELASPFFNDNENSCIATSSRSALNIAYISLLNVLNSELQSKVGAIVDTSFDIRDSKPKRGRKKSMDLSVPVIGKYPNMLPLNELTWSELARRYLLAKLSMDDNTDTVHTGKIFRCMVGDGGELCGSLIGVLGMEADALLLAQAMKKIFGSLEREFNMLTVKDEGADQPSVCQSSSPPVDDIPEWLQVLEPVRKLPTNVGARIKKCVNAALDKGPPEWAKEILQHSISKEVYKGNASGPTKKAVLSVLTTVYGEREGQKERRKNNEGKNYISICDIVMRQCRIILRKVAITDDQKVFCNLLAQRLNRSVESEDEGFLRCPVNFARPLDFRTIDLRLAVGAYDGSHEAFLEDVQEFWKHVRISCVEKPDLLRLADKLSSIFDELYGKEVLILYQKLLGYARLGCLTPGSKREVDEIIISSSVLPKAPWEAGICKICGIDKNDDLVLLCDTCDAEYHTYCLNPPLMRIPPGNWHCPSCVSKTHYGKGISVNDSANYCSKRKGFGEFSGVRFSEITQLAILLEDKDYWEFSVKERIMLLKFLSDEILNSVSIRQHIEHSMEASADLQQKLRSAYNDLRNMKHREERLAEKFAKSSKMSHLDASELYENASTLSQSPVEMSLGDSSEHNMELSSVKNGIMHLLDSISSMEVQLMKRFGRKEFLGADSAGRLYWLWANLERQLCVMVNDEVALWSPWVGYQSLSELKGLVSFLRDDDPRERELKGSILRKLSIRFHEGQTERSDEIKTDNIFGFLDFESLSTKAAGFLENTYGLWFELEIIMINKKGKRTKVISDDKLFRCSCLEPVIPSRYHCLTCHKTFTTKRESDSHDNHCKPSMEASKGENSSNVENDGLICPYNFEDISSKFVTMDSLKDLVREIGLLGWNGVPLFLSSVSSNLTTDPTLKLTVPSNVADISTGEDKNDDFADDRKGLFGSSSGVEPENKSSDKKDQNSSGANCNVIPKSALKPSVGKPYRVLIQLKMNLLDMEAALPKAALRASKACIKRRRAWRSFVKSAGTIDEMVQASIGLEDMIKADYLKNGWWFWSSLSSAAKISSWSALAFRIYSLDASIVYETTPVNFSVGKSESAVQTKRVKRKFD